MQYTIDELKRELFSNIYNVYEIFQNFFDPQFVDLQQIPADSIIEETLEDFEIPQGEQEGTWELDGRKLNRIKRSFETVKAIIYVWWPRVTVTNENDKSIVIQDLYAKILVSMDGTIPYESSGFQLNRATFNSIQFNSEYIHSHVPHRRGVPEFQNPCLGTGPIRNTILDLKNSYEETLWMLFCQELALYVTVESLRGGPYFRLESVGSSTLLTTHRCYTSQEVSLSLVKRYDITGEPFEAWIREFISWYLEHGHLCFNYQNGQFTSGLPYFDYIIDVSNSFIDFFNTHGASSQVGSLFSRSILLKVLAANGKFYKSAETETHDNSEYEGTHLLYFKGRDICLHIEEEESTHKELTILLNSDIANYIIQSILRVINYRYKNEYYNKQLGTEETSAPTYQTVLYL